MRDSFKLNLAGRVVAAVFVAQWSIFQIMLRNWDRVEVAARFYLGNDFEYIFKAAGLFLTGRSPYIEPGFIPLPSALCIPLALYPLGFWNALIAFRTICFVLVVVAMLWLCSELRLTSLNSALLLVITLTYVPFYSVLAGGNLDALMLAFLVFACARKEATRGAFLAFAIGTKFYALLLIPIIVILRRRREVIWALITIVVLLLPFLPYVREGFSSVLHRTSTLRLESNESPAVLFILLFGQKRVWAWATGYVLLWGGTLLARVVADLKNPRDGAGERWHALDYLPWMASAPVLVFTYTGTILLPVLACLIRKNQDRALNVWEWLTVAGFVLLGAYPVITGRALEYAFSILKIPASSLHNGLLVIAPLGVSAVLVGCSLAALAACRAAERKTLAAVPNPM